MGKDQPQLKGTKKDFGVETRDLLDISYKDVGDNNVQFLIKYEGTIVGVGYTDLLNLSDLKTDDGSDTEWRLVPKKIPTYQDHSAKIKWFDDTVSHYKVGQYLDSLNIKKWAENVWHNTKQDKYKRNPQDNIFKNMSKQGAYRELSTIKESFDKLWFKKKQCYKRR